MSPISPKSTSNTEVRLQKAIADLGLGSRRKVEQWIVAGRIKVDGEVATLGTRVHPKQTIELDGREVKANLPSALPRILIMNKSVGVEVSRRPSDDRKSVFSLLPKLNRGRWVSIGRLDVATSGLLLFSDSGELANRLMHPSAGLDREYAVRVNGHLEDVVLNRLLTGVKVDDEVMSFSDIQYFDGRGVNHWYHVCLMQGKNREVRRLFESQNYIVSRLKRVRYGPFILPSFLGSGRVVEIHPDEVKAVCSMLSHPIVVQTHSNRQSKLKRRSVLMEYPSLRLPAWSIRSDLS